MKLYHMIGLTAAGLLSLGTLGVLSQVKSVELNKDFQITTISGNVSALSGAGVENIIKESQNSFSKVILDGKTVDIQTTKYDSYHGLEKEKLDNRELYRNASFPTEFENKDYIVTTQIDYSFPYSSNIPTIRLAVKNKDTDKISVTNPILKNVTANEWFMDEFLTESNGTYYYTITTSSRYDSNYRILVYTFDPTTLNLIFKFEKSIENINQVVVTGHFIHFIAYDSTTNEMELNHLNLENGQLYKQSLESDLTIDSIFATDQTLYLASPSAIYKYDDQSRNSNVASLIKIMDISSIQEINEMSHFYISQSLEEDNKLFLLYKVYNQTSDYQLLTVSNLESNQLLFEGKLIPRDDQGLFRDYKLINLD